MLASLEGPDGSHPKYMQHRVGELELEKSITTTAIEDDVTNAKSPFTTVSSISEQHNTTFASESDMMNTHLEAFMATHSEVFAREGTPQGKLTAYIEQKKELAARHWKANASGRFANLSEAKCERLSGGK